MADGAAEGDQEEDLDDAEDDRDGEPLAVEEGEGDDVGECPVDRHPRDPATDAGDRARARARQAEALARPVLPGRRTAVDGVGRRAGSVVVHAAEPTDAAPVTSLKQWGHRDETAPP
ncbi:hypothetical protein IFT77_02200 [Frigoribacterium sp. CFBP 13729]|nr:hypothetical protein [Frigoribacterium sp. CFBP 13729]